MLIKSGTMPCSISAPQLKGNSSSAFTTRFRAGPARRWRSGRLIAAASIVVPPKPDARPPPGPKFFAPLIGETLDIVQEPIAFFEKRVEEFGPVFKTHFAGEQVVAVADTALIKDVFAAEHEAVSFDVAKSIDTLTQSKLLPRVASSGKDAQQMHRMDRQFLGKYFTSAAVESYYPFMQSYLEEKIISWVETGNVVKFAEESKAFAFAVMNTQLAGVDFSKEQLEELDKLFCDFTNGAVDLLAIDLPGTAYAKGKAADKRICQIIQESLEASYGADMQSRNFSDSNMVTGFLLQKNQDGSWKYDMAEATKAMRSILFAGHETTAGSICIMMHYLSRHPDVVDQLQKEQKELIERFGPTLTPEMLSGTYTEAVAVESLRFQNINKTTRSPGILGRKAVVDFEIDGNLIKKGQKLILATNYTVSRIEEFLPTCEEFKPERWLTPGKSAVAAYRATDTSIFGGGPRVCAGEALAWAEIKVFLSLLGRNLSWEIINPDAEWKRAQGSLFKSPEDGMLIRFSKLKASEPQNALQSVASVDTNA